MLCCLRKIALAAQCRYPWRKGRVPTGRPFGKPCRKESRPESMVAWRDSHVRKMVEEDSSTMSPSQGAWLSEASTLHARRDPLLTSHWWQWTWSCLESWGSKQNFLTHCCVFLYTRELLYRNMNWKNFVLSWWLKEYGGKEEISSLFEDIDNIGAQTWSQMSCLLLFIQDAAP